MKNQKVRELVKAYAPGFPVSKIGLLAHERALPSLMKEYISKHFPRSKKTTLSGSSLPTEESETDSDVVYYSQGDSTVAELFCPQELAYEIISRNSHKQLIEKYSLSDLSYTGDSFLVTAEGDSLIQDAVGELINKIKAYESPPKVAKNSGTARDLINRKFTKNIKFVGGSECIFCANQVRIGELVRRTPCLHLYHSKCLEPWLAEHRICPIDNMPLPIK